MTITKRTLCIIFMVAAFCGTPALAAGQEPGAIVRVTALSSPRLSVYERASNDSKLRELDKEGVKLPLDVLDATEDERFLKVRIGDDSVWIKAAHVMVLRSVAAGCLAQNAAPVPAGVIRGGNRGCAK